MRKVAHTYVKAFFECVRKGDGAQKRLERFSAEFRALALFFKSVFQISAPMKIALLSPLSAPSEKEALVKGLLEKVDLSMSTSSGSASSGASSEELGGGVSQEMKNFFSLLARYGRLSIVFELPLVFEQMVLQSQGKGYGQVWSAEPLKEKDQALLEQAFSKKLKKEVKFFYQIQASLLAGLRIQIQGLTYDGSLKTQVERLKENLFTAFSKGESYVSEST